MDRKELFLSMLKDAKKDNLFIGTGNPYAQFLIVGKEASINEQNKEQINREIKNNIIQWERDINKQQDEILFREWGEGNFSPLYPYKGQLNIRDSRIRNKNAEYNWGTSPTWFSYQKLRDKILNTKSNEINFHENCFITEFSTETARYSMQANKMNRESSVRKQTESLFPSAYIQSFPIVVLACGNYPRDFGIDICSLFGVQGDSANKILVDGKKIQWYIPYRNASENSPKLVINTRQFSMIYDGLIDKIADEVRDFCEENGISIL